MTPPQCVQVVIQVSAKSESEHRLITVSLVLPAADACPSCFLHCCGNTCNELYCKPSAACPSLLRQHPYHELYCKPKFSAACPSCCGSTCIMSLVLPDADACPSCCGSTCIMSLVLPDADALDKPKKMLMHWINRCCCKLCTTGASAAMCPRFARATIHRVPNSAKVTLHPRRARTLLPIWQRQGATARDRGLSQLDVHALAAGSTRLVITVPRCCCQRQRCLTTRARPHREREGVFH